MTATAKATGAYLVQTDAGQRLTYAMLRKRFDGARVAAGEAWQFRDVRKAQALLGHRSETTTAGIYRRLRGAKVEPVR